MAHSIFVNLPVQDLARSRAFYAGLGFSFNEQFSNDQGACVVVAEQILVMLLVKPFFATFTSKPIADAHQTTEVLNCLSCESREKVDELVRLAKAHGGSAPREAQDHGFMYGHGFEDPDGHIWELVYMAPVAES
ncbi:MAG: glyoxalase/bleomycin resistance/extradiol dioxygenase family protein [Moraxellaceae bacterium]|jgi:predicted lactoylglutathione lyase|nr:glyoxalase/bleomycin resistance/extradiol dioxygenase family protein [Moraxellaceae bacterium]